MSSNRVADSGPGRALKLAILSLAFFMAGLLPAVKAGLAAQRSQDEPVKLKATLVQVPVVVSEPGGRYVTDLKKGDFELFEDGVGQTIELFSSVDEPFSAVLLLDTSGSTSDQLNQIKAAALAFIDTLRERDRVMVISFDDSVHVQSGLIGDRELLRRAVRSATSGEFTQVYEAIYTAVWEKLRGVEGRRAVIVFTDGIDTASSEIDEDDTLDAIVDSENVLVYPIRYSTRGDVERRLARSRGSTASAKSPVKPQEDRRLALDQVYRSADVYLNQLAELSGGVVERADTLSDLSGALARIADELRHQYLLGYYPSDMRKSDRERKISVRVARREVKVRARPGYRLSS